MQLKMDRNFQFIRIYSSIIFWLFIINNNVYGDHYSDPSGCNFQTRQCNWTFSSNWQWQPIVDEHDQHSLQLNSTTFAEQDGGYELENHLIRNEFIQSPEFSLESSSEYYCFDFDYYFMNDDRHDDQNYLALYLFESNSTDNGKKIWVTPILNTDFWHHTYVDLPKPSKSFRLKFIADSDGGLMAVKNFHLKYDHCQNNVDICDFETSICGWKSSWEGGITIRRKLAFYTGTPKGIDHTTLTSDGHVLYGKYSSAYDVSNASLTSPVIDKFSGEKCFQFWIWINEGPIEYLKLSLHQLSNDIKTTNIWKLHATQQMVEKWIRFQVTLNSAESSTTRLQFHLNYTGRGSIRFDDFDLFSNKCPEKISCNFLLNTCGWKNQLNDDNQLTWNIGIGRVHDVTKLTFLNSAKNFIYHTKPLLYTDFTKLSDGKIGQMQMISEIVENGIPKHGACLRMNYEVWSFDSKTDKFFINYQTFLGKTETREKEIWHFNSNNRGNNTVTLQLPYTDGELFRLILTAKSAHSSTYITVKEIQFWEKSSINDDCSKSLV
ncbi:MAM and LDL-receptor class A domain-containing protein 2-like [Dermatophagoides pteronyssinus]|uniref:MAM and LDL-receptor class A domain-containing protein 2-like n=1 Tax=Dermatophagoides pteronyssinus TaxID=6956 RepID=UPI003F67ADEE